MIQYNFFLRFNAIFFSKMQDYFGKYNDQFSETSIVADIFFIFLQFNVGLFQQSLYDELIECLI